MRAVQHFNFLDWIVPALLWKLKILVRAQLQLFKLFKATFSRVEKVHWNFCVLKMLKTFPHPSLGSVVQSYAVIGPFLSWFLFEWLHFSSSVAHCTGIQEVVQARNHSTLSCGWNKAIFRSKLGNQVYPSRSALVFWKDRSCKSYCALLLTLAWFE